jgi:hypothetical protein
MMMEFRIVLYDNYFNIPLRGLMETNLDQYAFQAEVLADEPSDLAERPGVYSRIRGFKCDDVLKQVFAEKDAIFQKWRRRFDRGEVDTSTHPSYSDAKYQELMSSADEMFRRLDAPVIDAIGLMRVESGTFVFERLAE